MSAEKTMPPPAEVLSRINNDGLTCEMVALRNVPPTDQRKQVSSLQNCSNDTENSATNEVKISASACDSGNCSSSSNKIYIACPLDMEIHNHCQHMHNLLKERSEALFLAMQEVRKLHSELERINKSEEWYKKELRAQKCTRLEALERLYDQERKYMQDNQRLQRECVRLYEKCGEMEKELQSKQEKDVKKFVENGAQKNNCNSSDKEDNFELEHRRALIDDQQNLINVLRKQKQSLLEDLKRLSEEKDSKVIELQESLAGILVENTRMTTQCKRLLTERQVLEDTLQSKNAALNAENVEKMKMEKIIKELTEQCNQQHQELMRKEQEVQDVQHNFKHIMENEKNMDEVHRLSVSYHDEINAKTSEIKSLKKSLHAVQIELDALTGVQAQNEEHERQIEHLNFALETRQCELSNLQVTDEEKTQQIRELQRNLENTRTQHDLTLKKLQTAESSLKNIKRELIALHEKYANMCALCERTRFELELLEIEKNKLKFKVNADNGEIELLRCKLISYMKHTEALGARINALENELKCLTTEKDELIVKLKSLEKQPKQKLEQDFKNIQCIIQPRKGLVHQLNDENPALGDAIGKERNVDEVRQYEEDDSGFLDAPKDNLSEINDYNDKDVSELQSIWASDSSKMTTASNTLLKQLSTQNEILKDRQIVIDAFEKRICNDVSFVELKNDLFTQQGQDTEECSDILERQEKMIENLNNQSLLTLERRQLLETFETLFNEEVGLQGTPIESQKISEMKKLIKENKKLNTQLTVVKQSPQEINPAPAKIMLDKQKQFVQELKENSNENQLLPPERQELLNLRAKVKKLETSLQTTILGDKKRRIERVQLIQKLLELQNSKVKQLSESQEEWEELLAALQTAQKCEENARDELQLKHAELEQLNALFAEQNEELRRLQETALLAEVNNSCNREETGAQLADCQEKQRQIEELQGKNERLERHLNEDYAEEVAKYQRQLRMLQTKVEALEIERNRYADRLAEMEIELQQLKKSKREGLVLPPEFVVLPQTAITASNPGEVRSMSSDTNGYISTDDSDNNDRMRILTKVLEAEYRRKMKRYDVHIHTLLGNIKKLKRALRAAEQRSAHLSMTQSKAMEELHSLKSIKSQLAEMQTKCDHNQSTIKALELALDVERKKFEASELGKETCARDSAVRLLPQDEPAHEVANLIDDYKKLIQQSALATQRPKTSAILDLIKRSNQCVPNLHKLEKTVDGLRGDLEPFLSAYALHISKPQIAHKTEGPSLLDELRAAAEIY